MTNQEIIDRLRRLTTWLAEDHQEQAADLLDELSSRLSDQVITMNLGITGSPAILAAAIGKIITDNTSEADLEQLRNDLMLSLANRPD
ncbi:hypothetical protein NIES2135_57990 [Leptolyngbya boryana NIES-2135]|jgi:hypothetical protein|uniref:Uncharacterized protein n=1 Tax=Leptolyngbya boryana NIES-2135 TaxID=1973484 RepID=A0A1Z4JQD4_LEPBY|nr:MULTISPECIES: hypothetical protein [Leptolyngbya]BAY58924.1 hypothetical protein NIES2135_57990 [Leptolyngbya boryana NIES-2135]MBD2370488.1 hypothetical protein [Leptolyngbya sp. FACHB-161]MBD2376912.1 hypothetical protein [Leptolyngbya sp. FACHB-238]MBD2401279.1 hypothetical protein [Leptolyngbya sp. FACHB-239]MBD2407830.1 hypothetical protein [Leptolyngbya sp. FACHB-402]